MPLAAERLLRQHMRDQAFERVYYFFGEDDFLKESTAREFVACVTDAGTREFNSEVLRGVEVTAEALDLAVNTPPLFATRRVVLVRDAQSLAKDVRAMLDRYLRAPSESTVLVLTIPAGAEADQDILARTTAVNFQALEERRIPRWIAHYAAESLGTEITADAAALLHEAAGSELAALAAELDKAASFTGGGQITTDTITAVVGVRRGESLGDLLDAVVSRDARRAAALVPAVLAQPKQTPVQLVMMLAAQVLAIGWGQARQQRSRGARLESEYFTLLKETRAYTGRPWGEATSSWARATPHWSARDIDNGIAALLATDHALKETRVSSDDQLVTTLVLELCGSRGRSEVGR